MAGINNIGLRASSGMVVVFDDANNNKILSIKQGHSSNVDIGLVSTGYAAGYKVARGTNHATWTATITTGLTTIVAFAFGRDSMQASTANNAETVCGKVSSGTLYVYRYKHTSAINPTLIAATTPATLNWVAVGT